MSRVKKLSSTFLVTNLGEFLLFDSFLNLEDFLLFDLLVFSFMGFNLSPFPILPALLTANTYDDIVVFSNNVSGATIILNS